MSRSPATSKAMQKIPEFLTLSEVKSDEIPEAVQSSIEDIIDRYQNQFEIVFNDDACIAIQEAIVESEMYLDVSLVVEQAHKIIDKIVWNAIGLRNKCKKLNEEFEKAIRQRTEAEENERLAKAGRFNDKVQSLRREIQDL